MVDVELAKTDPASVFKRPSDIVREVSLSRGEKIEILRSWAYDQREMSVAEEENMRGIDSDRNNILDEILQSLQELGVEGDQPNPPPTEEG